MGEIFETYLNTNTIHLTLYIINVNYIAPSLNLKCIPITYEFSMNAVLRTNSNYHETDLVSQKFNRLLDIKAEYIGFILKHFA